MVLEEDARERERALRKERALRTVAILAQAVLFQSSR